MAKNDFTPIVFNTLAILYNNLKKDKKNDESIFDRNRYGISSRYMDIIINYLISDGYVFGIKSLGQKISDDNYRIDAFEFSNAEITPKGIIHLEDILISDKKEELYPYDISDYFTTFKKSE